MALPRKLKNMNLFNDGNSYMGQVTEITLPKLKRKMEEYRAGGMIGPVQIDLGLEALEIEWTCGGLMHDVLAQYGAANFDGVALRFAGAYQREDNAAVDAVEIAMRGRHQEIDLGTVKIGDDTTFKVTSALSYYKLTINGKILIEIDCANCIENINGSDRLTNVRRAIGL